MSGPQMGQILFNKCLFIHSVQQQLLQCICCGGYSKAEFDRIIAKWVLKESEGETKTTHPWKVSDTDLWSQSDKVRAVVDLYLTLTVMTAESQSVLVSK